MIDQERNRSRQNNRYVLNYYFKKWFLTSASTPGYNELIEEASVIMKKQLTDFKCKILLTQWRAKFTEQRAGLKPKERQERAQVGKRPEHSLIGKGETGHW